MPKVKLGTDDWDTDDLDNLLSRGEKAPFTVKNRCRVFGSHRKHKGTSTKLLDEITRRKALHRRAKAAQNET